jgi:uncharacterized protein (TIGR01777 family)
MQPPDPRLAVAISGSHGLIGSAVASRLASEGHEVRRLPRGVFEPGALEGLDGVVHLGGAGIADKRWTEARRRVIRDSRVEGTERLVAALTRLSRKPSVLVSASAIGDYGARGEERIDESAGPGEGFLADVCRAWEAAAEGASRAGIRTVLARIGIVLTPRGGALAKMLTPFRLGAGGPIGSGTQGFSWVALDDVVRAIVHAMQTSTLSGPVNVVAPGPVSQREFARALGHALGRPAILPLPAFVVRAVLGRLGEEALLAGSFVVPKRLSESGFQFSHPSLDRALEHLL